MMKRHSIVLISLVFVSCFLGIDCTGTSTAPDRTPKAKTVRVDYERIALLNPEGMDRATLAYNYVKDGIVSGSSPMTREAENKFSVSLFIYTEIQITVYVRDPRTWDGTSYDVRRRIFIDNQELIVSTLRGVITFIYRNDGTINVLNP